MLHDGLLIFDQSSLQHFHQLVHECCEDGNDEERH